MEAMFTTLIGLAAGFFISNYQSDQSRKRNAKDSFLSAIADLKVMLDTQRRDPIVFYERSLPILGGAVYRYVTIIECEECREGFRGLWQKYLSYDQEDSERTDFDLAVAATENERARVNAQTIANEKVKLLSQYLDDFVAFVSK